MGTESTDTCGPRKLCDCCRYTLGTAVYLLVYCQTKGVRMKKKKKPPTFGEHLRAFRESRGLFQEQLAEAAGTTKTTIYRLETGRKQPSWVMAVSLAAALGISVERFLDADLTPTE